MDLLGLYWKGGCGPWRGGSHSSPARQSHDDPDKVLGLGLGSASFLHWGVVLIGWLW